MKKTYPIEIVRSGNVFDNIYFIKFNNSFIDYIDMNCSSLITGYYDISKRQIVNNKCRLDDEGPYEEIFIINHTGSEVEEKSIDVSPRLLLSKRKITTIEDLKKYFKKLIPISQALLKLTKEFKESHIDNCQFNYSCDLNDDYLNLLVEQLVFDALYKKYNQEAEKITRNRYFDSMNELFDCDSSDYIELKYQQFEFKNFNIDAFKQQIKRAMIRKYQQATSLEKMKFVSFSKISIPNLDYMEYHVPDIKQNLYSKRTKAEWNEYLFNTNMGNGRYSSKGKEIFADDYEAFMKNICNYRFYVEKTMLEDFDSNWFNKTIEYYTIECRKRIDSLLDFSTKLIEHDSLMVNTKEFREKMVSLLRCFCPEISMVTSLNGKPIFCSSKESYSPMIFIEQKIYSDIIEEIASINFAKGFDETFKKAHDCLRNIHLIRAKTYELFEFYAEYKSEDNCDVKNFIINSYNLTEYFEKIWKNANLDEKNYKKNQERTQKLINQFIEAKNQLNFI